MKRVYRSQTNKVFSGVFGGLGEYFDTDPALLRVLYMFLAIFTAFAPAFLAYIFAAVIIPSERSETHETHSKEDSV